MVTRCRCKSIVFTRHCCVLFLVTRCLWCRCFLFHLFVGVCGVCVTAVSPDHWYFWRFCWFRPPSHLLRMGHFVVERHIFLCIIRTNLLAWCFFPFFASLAKTHPKPPFGIPRAFQPPPKNIVFPGYYFVLYWFCTLFIGSHVGPAPLPFCFHRWPSLSSATVNVVVAATTTPTVAAAVGSLPLSLSLLPPLCCLRCQRPLLPSMLPSLLPFVTKSLVDILVWWLQYLVSKMEFTVLNSPKGFWRSLPEISLFSFFCWS